MAAAGDALLTASTVFCHSSNNEQRRSSASFFIHPSRRSVYSPSRQACLACQFAGEPASSLALPNWSITISAAMAYVQGGEVRGERSPSIASIIRETFFNVLNFLVAFFKTMFSLEVHENYGKAADNGQAGGAPGSVAPRRINKVHGLFDNNYAGSSGAAGDHGNVFVINSSRAWQTKVSEAKTARKVIVVDFTASWCGPCKLMAPVFAELSKKYGQLIFVKVDVDEVQEVASQYGVRAMPTFLFIKDGQQLDSVVGADKNELERKCSRYATSR